LTHFFNAPLLTRALLAFVGALPWLVAAFGLNLPAVHGIFHGLCHQRPERSLFILGSQMAVCSRCAGIYAGLFIGTLTPPLGFMARYGRTVVWTAFSIAAFDVAATFFSLYPLNHTTRLVTGFFAGWAVCSFLLSCLKNEGARQNGYGEN
jgi:uncharacterized membrane protein